MDHFWPEIETPAQGSSDPFLANFSVVNEALAYVIRLRRLGRDESEDFAANVMVRLLENDRAVIRKHEGRSSLKSFLIAVIDRMLLDHRIMKWGKWRPSAEAQRLGPVALSLERLVSRDGRSFAEACEVIRTEARGRICERELTAIWQRLPVRTRRRFLTDRALDDLPFDTPAPDLALLRPRAERTLALLRRCFARLSEEQRSLMRQRFVARRTVADIARSQGIEQKQLYRMFDGLLHRLRAELECEHIDAGEVRSWLGKLQVPPQCRVAA